MLLRAPLQPPTARMLVAIALILAAVVVATLAKPPGKQVVARRSLDGDASVRELGG